MRNRIALTLVAACFLVPVAPAADAPATKRALLIGIDKYENHPALSEFNGAANDVRVMESVLRGRFDFKTEYIRKLVNEAAKRADIVRELEALTQAAGPSDVVVVHFSGYGSQVPGDPGEIDGLDETLVPFDGKLGGAGELTDDEMNGFMSAIAKRTPNVTLILDVCFGGRASADEATMRCIGSRGNSQATRGMKSFTGAERFPFKQRSDYTLIIASQTGQPAYEVNYATGRHGAFTYEIVSAMINEPGAVSWGQLSRRVAANVTARFPAQEPVWEIAGPSGPMLHDVGARREFVVPLDVSNPKLVQIGAGTFHGLRSGSRIGVYPSDVADFGAPVAEVQVTKLAAYAGEGYLARSGKLPKLTIGRIERSTDNTRVSMWFDLGSPQNGELAKLRDYMRTQPRAFVLDNPDGAQLQVTGATGSYSILAGDRTPLVSGLGTVGEVDAALRNWVRWYGVQQLDNPQSPLRIRVAIGRPASGSSDATPLPLTGPVRPGEILVYSVSNLTDTPLIAQTLLLSSEGTVELANSGPMKLGPKETRLMRIGTFLPDNSPGLTDYVKVIASPALLNLSPLVGKGDIKPGMFGNTPWTTDQASYLLRRQTTRLEGFAVHREASGPSKAGPYGREPICSTGKERDCLTGTSITDDGSIVFLDTSFKRMSAETIAPGEAFQQAYDLRAATGAARVEPLFNVAMSGGGGIQARVTGTINDPDAAANKLWSLEYVKAPAAQVAVRTALNLPAGREAQGVRIAHLDTGYRRHPELFYESGDYATVLPAMGFNLVGETRDPFDPLLRDSLLASPGHGTSSGSVIVSPLGCQLTGAQAPCVNGTAPGAQLIPVRVTSSVVVLNQRRMAEAIFAVAEGKRVRGNPRIISLAMGGAPSWALWRASRKAERAGMLLIAPAGNFTDTVVWPARFDSAIAVGAISIKCLPWSGSSAGSRVDISAPGESVWRAQVNPDTQSDFISMGSGTTYAAATTAGVASLWVARHADSPEFRRLIETGAVTREFRRAIKATAWRPIAADGRLPPNNKCAASVTWDGNRNGAGVVDAEKLVIEPLQDGGARTATPDSFADLPLFASLYPRNADRVRVGEEYRRLFKGGSTDLAQFEAEILFQYSTNDNVRGPLDRIIEGGAPVEFDRAHAALTFADISPALRAALGSRK